MFQVGPAAKLAVPDHAVRWGLNRIFSCPWFSALWTPTSRHQTWMRQPRSQKVGNSSREESKGGKAGRAWCGATDQRHNDKWCRLQDYYCSAVMSTMGNREAMNFAIWASLFHCIWTNEDPHHKHCPSGEGSWCFFNSAAARGEQPAPHQEKVGTPIARDVVMEIVPIYWPMSSPSLLLKIAHGKMQNSNYDLVSLSEGGFCGLDRLSGANFKNRSAKGAREAMDNKIVHATHLRK